jgi:HEAT repeat protein
LRDLPAAQVVAPGFGASDCDCTAHLVYSPTVPTDDWFGQVLEAGRILMGRQELTELLSELTSDHDRNREETALALARFGDAAVEPLAALLRTGDVDSRWWAARALAEVGGEVAVSPLVGALSDPDADVRACAALALGQIGEGVACRALAACLGDESTFVASIAADALTMIGESAVEALIEMITAESSHVRLLVVRALARIKSERAIASLFGMLEDPSYLVRFYAQEALEALGMGMVFLAP